MKSWRWAQARTLQTLDHPHAFHVPESQDDHNSPALEDVIVPVSPDQDQAGPSGPAPT